MKVGSKLVFLFRDSDGFGSAIFESFAPNPENPSSLRSLEEPFELSLERYGITDVKASGTILHFVDDDLGLYKVSFLLMQNYEPPVLACAVNEVLEQIAGKETSQLPEILAPFVVSSSKLTSGIKVPIFGAKVGPETDITKALVGRTEKLPSSLQITHEPLACLLQLACVSNLPAFFLIGERGRHSSTKDLEILYEIGDILARALDLCFLKDRVRWNPIGKASNNNAEPWRALYG